MSTICNNRKEILELINELVAMGVNNKQDIYNCNYAVHLGAEGLLPHVVEIGRLIHEKSGHGAISEATSLQLLNVLV